MRKLYFYFPRLLIPFRYSLFLNNIRAEYCADALLAILFAVITGIFGKYLGHPLPVS